MSLLDDLIRNAETIAENYIGFLKDELTEFDVPTGLSKVRNFQFAGCGNLETVTLHDDITEIGKYAFYECRSLNSIQISDTVTSIGGYAFAYCTSLENVNLPETLTLLTSHAFESSGLKSITVPGSISRVPYMCFAQSSVEVVMLKHGVTSIDTDAFYGVPVREAFLPNTMGDYTNQLFSSSNALNHIILENGYNATLNASRLGAGSTQGEYVNWLVDMLNALADRTGQTAKTLTLGTDNLNRLTNEQRAIAINKNWNLA